MTMERPPRLPSAKFDSGHPDPDEAVMKWGRWLEHRLPHEWKSERSDYGSRLSARQSKIACTERLCAQSDRAGH
jgi:hypothetical protein